MANERESLLPTMRERPVPAKDSSAPQVCQYVNPVNPSCCALVIEHTHQGEYKISVPQMMVLTHSGLRGAVALILALVVDGGSG